MTDQGWASVPVPLCLQTPGSQQPQGLCTGYGYCLALFPPSCCPMATELTSTYMHLLIHGLHRPLVDILAPFHP